MLHDIHAQPDGQFHWTKAQQKKLAEFEASDPFTIKVRWRKMPEITLEGELVACEQAVLDEAQAFIAGNPFDRDKWSTLLHELFTTPNLDTEVLYKVFYELDVKLPKEDSRISDIIVLYILIIKAKADCEEMDIKRNWVDFPSNYSIYHLYGRKVTKAEKTATLEKAKALGQQFPEKTVQDFLFYLLPDDFPISGDISFYSRFGDEMMHFFDRIDIFCHIYYSRFYDRISEPHLLLTIKRHETEVLRIIRLIFEGYVNALTRTLRKGDYGKVRKQLRLLDNYHHVDILDFLFEYSDETEVIPFIKQWLERFPLFTLQHLIDKLLNLPEDSDQYANISALLSGFLYDHPALIKHINETVDTAEQTLLATLTTGITPEEIETAYQAMQTSDNTDTAQHAKVKKTTKETTKKTTKQAAQKDTSDGLPPLVFPMLQLERIAGKEAFKIENLEEANKVGEIGKYNHSLWDIMMNNPDAYLFNYYQESGLGSELVTLKQHYDNFSVEQKYLLHLAVAPSVLLSDKFTQAVAGNYRFTGEDFLALNIPLSIYLEEPDDGSSYDSSSLFDIAFKGLSNVLKKAMLGGELPLAQYHYLSSKYILHHFGGVIVNYMQSCGDEVVADVTKYLPLFSKFNIWVATMTEAIDSYRVVPYQLNAFNTKTKKYRMTAYFEHFPETVVNEMVYLLFTKQSGALQKKAQKSARVFFDWLMDNDKDLLLKTLTRYDQQLEKPALIPFLDDYQAHQQALQDIAKVPKIVPDAIIDASGVPVALLDDTWRKSTRKRNLDIEDYINKHSLPIVTIEKTQQPLSRTAFERLLQMLRISTFDKPMPMLLPILKTLSKPEQTALADALWDKYESLHLPSKDKWLMMASGFLYHEDLGDNVWQFIKDWESDPHNRSSVKLSFAVLAQQAISHPDTKACDNALRMLIRISQKARATLRPTAQEEIERYTNTVGLSNEDISDTLIPTLGLDAQGKRVFDFGERKFTLTLDENLKLKFTDDKGKIFKNLPKAGQKDDADKAQQAHAELKAIKSQLKAFIRDDVPRMENMLITQRRLTFAKFKQFYVGNPLMLRYCFQLIWGVFEPNRDKENEFELIQPFRVVETGEILDINDDDLSIKEDALIGLVHPLQLTEAQQSKLGKSLQDDEIIQPFIQLSRPVYRLTDEERKSQTITRFNDVTFATGSLIGFRNKGWEAEQWSGGVCNGYSKRVNGHMLYFCFMEGFGLWEGVPDNDKGQKLDPIELPEGMSEIDISEFLYVLDSMARL